LFFFYYKKNLHILNCLEILATDIVSLKCDVKFIKRTIISIKKLIERKETSICNADIFSQNHSLSPPIDNLAEFIKFIERLKNDDELRVDVVSKIKIFNNFKLYIYL